MIVAFLRGRRQILYTIDISMKQQWTPQELIDHWTLTNEEVTLVQDISQTDYNQLGAGLLLKHFQIEGKFPQRKQDIPPTIVEHIAHQLHMSSSVFARYQLKGRSVRRHQLRIRQLLQFRGWDLYLMLIL